MYNLGIFTGNDLKKKTLEEMATLFGKSGVHYYNIVRGVHNSPVKPNRIRKSVGAERTFRENIASEVFMLDKLNDIADEIERRMEKTNAKGKTIHVIRRKNDEIISIKY